MQSLVRKTSPVVKMPPDKKGLRSFSTTGIALYLLMLTALTGTGFFGGAEKAEAAECTIKSATFSTVGDPKSKGWFKDDAKPAVKLTVEGSPDCAGTIAEVSIVDDGDLILDDDVDGKLDDLEIPFPASNKFIINLKAGEDECGWGQDPDCQYYIKIDKDGDNFSTENKGGAGNLGYDCDGLCDEDWEFVGIERPGEVTSENANGECVVKSGQYTYPARTNQATCMTATPAARQNLLKIIGSEVIIQSTSWRQDDYSQTPGANGLCRAVEDDVEIGTSVRTSRSNCTVAEIRKSYEDADAVIWVQATLDQSNDEIGAQNKVPGESPFEKEINENLCFFAHAVKGTFEGCIVQTVYFFFYVIPAFLLAQVAFFFNVMISVTLSSDLFQGEFVREAWGIVRDLANLFFILILLYVAVELILGMAHDAKKTIIKVVLAALLINFSMFFTGVVIDSSNILALVFYNKLQVETTVNGQPRPYDKVGSEKDVSGAMVAAFNPLELVSQATLDQAKQVYVNGVWKGAVKRVPVGTLIAMLIIAGLMMGFAMYALFVAAFSFLGRLIELWVLIIASPFAFMSSTIPEMEGIKDWGWKNWFHRLITAAFMGSAFMFFLYFIFLLIHSNIFEEIVSPAKPGEQDAAGFIKTILGQVLPALLILILLLKSVKLAKASAGQIGETVAKFGEKVAGMAGTLALGAATGGAGLLAGAAASGAGKAGRATAGRVAEHIGQSQRVKEMGFGGEAVRGALKSVSTASFDLRATKAGKAAGLKGEAQKGGWVQSRKDQVEKRVQRAKELEVSEDEPLQQEKNKLEMDKQELLRKASHDIEMLERRDKVYSKRQSDARSRQQILKAITHRTAAQNAELADAEKEALDASAAVRDINAHRKAIKDGKEYIVKTEAGALHNRGVGTKVDYGAGTYVKTKVVDGQVVEDGEKKTSEDFMMVRTGTDGKPILVDEKPISINRLEDDFIPDAEHAIQKENRERKIKYTKTLKSKTNKIVNMIITGGEYSPNAGTREAEHKIIMEAKIENKKEN